MVPLHFLLLVTAIAGALIKEYDTTVNPEQCLAIAASVDRNYIWTACNAAGVYIAQHSINRAILYRWQLSSGGEDSARALAIHENSQDLLVCGRTNGPLGGEINRGSYDLFVARVSQTGQTIWVRTFGTSALDSCTSITVDQDTGVAYFVGISGSAIVVYAISPDGVELWQRQFTGPYAYGIMWAPRASDPNDCIIVAWGDNTGYFITRIARNNTVTHSTETQAQGCSSCFIYAARYQKSTDRVYLAGYTYSSVDDLSVTGYMDGMVLVFQAADLARLQKSVVFGTTAQDRFYDIAFSPFNDDYAVTGFTQGSLPGYSHAGGNDAFISVFNSDGVHRWSNQFGVSSQEYSNGITWTSTGHIVTASSNDPFVGYTAFEDKYVGAVAVVSVDPYPVSESDTSITVNLYMKLLMYYPILSLKVFNRQCIDAIWIGNTSIRCSVPPGVGRRAPLTLALDNAGTNLTATGSVYYQVPSFTTFSPSVGECAGGSQLTLSGVAQTGQTGDFSVWIGDQQCQSATRINLIVMCTIPSSTGPSTKSVMLRAGDQSYTSLQTFTYSGPVVTSILPSTSFRTTGGQTLTILGRNFGVCNSELRTCPTIVVKIGTRPCSNVQRVSDGEVFCTTPAGSGQNQPVIVVIDGFTSTEDIRFNYEGPKTTAKKTTTVVDDSGESDITKSSAESQVTVSAAVYALIGSLVALVGVIACLFVYRRQLVKTKSKERTLDTLMSKRSQKSSHTRSSTKEKSSSHVQGILSSPSSTQVSGSRSGTNSSAVTMTVTSVATTHELSIPAFLEVRIGNDFLLGDILAKGGAGSIFLCIARGDRLVQRAGNALMVVKNLNKDLDALTPRESAAFKQEIALMYRFRDEPFFARMFGFSSAPACLLIKFYRYGDLMDFITGGSEAIKYFKYSKACIIRLFRQLCSAVATMHRINMVHCDIKPANALLDQDPSGMLTIALTDFGIARVLDDVNLQVKAFEVSNLRGVSIVYAAPDVFFRFRSRTPTTDPRLWKAGDTYALAILLLELMSRVDAWKRKLKQ